MNIFKVYRNNSKTSFVKVLMQIKSYILVRLTEAWNFVSGLPYQIGFFVSVVSTWSQEQRQALLTCENWPSWHHSFAEDGSSHLASLARGAYAACGDTGAASSWRHGGAPECLRSGWGGSSSSSKKEVSGIYRHRHTNTLKKQIRHWSCTAGHHHAVEWLKQSYQVLQTRAQGASISKDEAGVFPPIKDPLF